ncbi:MAG: alpha/beta fold hydrolase [Candidatus Promineifilaceae bacterium]|nr:alpha/beta fold hydrolase [Candidatus Promineifilaceae bacterium]
MSEHETRSIVTKKEDDQASSAARLPAALLATAVALGGGWIGFSKMLIDHNLPLPLALNAERHLFTSAGAGLLNYYEAEGEGTPLVLLHSINAAASAYEVRPLFEHYRGQQPVYALDLPGFGLSERSDRHYSPQMYAAAIRDFLEKIVEEPADVVALSLSSEFAARAALENPHLFRSLTLISPTGFSEKESEANGAPSEELHRLFSFPLWSRPLFDLISSRPSINYFLQKSFHGSADEDMAAYGYLSAHQPGAHHAPLYFISGRLHTPQVQEKLYERLALPVLVLYDEDPYTAFGALPDLLLAHPNWSAVRVRPTRGLPHFEQLETVARVLDNFWNRLEGVEE